MRVHIATDTDTGPAPGPSWPSQPDAQSGGYLEIWGPILQQDEVKQKRNRRQASERFMRTYGVGMALGYLGVHFSKKLVRKIPLLGRPVGFVLDLLPTSVMGPALGAALAYGVEEGDLFAARHKIRRGVEAVAEQLPNIAEQLPELEARSQAGARAVKDMVTQSVDAMERELVPALEAQRTAAQRTLNRMREWEAK